jgi:hypothetical protein
MLNQKGWKKKESVEYEGREEGIRYIQLLHNLIPILGTFLLTSIRK